MLASQLACQPKVEVVAAAYFRYGAFALNASMTARTPVLCACRQASANNNNKLLDGQVEPGWTCCTVSALTRPLALLLPPLTAYCAAVSLPLPPALSLSLSLQRFSSTSSLCPRYPVWRAALSFIQLIIGQPCLADVTTRRNKKHHA